MTASLIERAMQKAGAEPQAAHPRPAGVENAASDGVTPAPLSAGPVEPRCSFCGRSRLEVGLLVCNEAGTRGICDHCFDVCVKAFAERRAMDTARKGIDVKG